MTVIPKGSRIWYLPAQRGLDTCIDLVAVVRRLLSLVVSATVLK